MKTMRELIDELPEQLAWAGGRDVPDVPPARAAIVAGMGGSGISGDAAAVAAADAGSRVAVHKAYGLPPWSRDELVVAVSHSGNTEETQSAVTAAVGNGLDLVAVTTGGALAERAASQGFGLLQIPPGPQPRAAFGYLAGGVLRVLEAAGVVGPQAADLNEAAAVVQSLLEC